jgi:ABC-type microcin C transport system duplicated ATPase subunit YejF
VAPDLTKSAAQTALRPTVPGSHLLEVDDLSVEFRTDYGTVRAVNSLSYHLDKGETLAILGESGSGKSVSAQAIMGIIDTPPGYVTSGQIRYQGRDLLTMGKAEQRAMRGAEIAIVFQDALSALNPVFTVGAQIAEMFRVHRGTSKKEALAKAGELMDRVRIPSAFLSVTVLCFIMLGDALRDALDPKLR